MTATRRVGRPTARPIGVQHGPCCVSSVPSGALRDLNSGSAAVVTPGAPSCGERHAVDSNAVCRAANSTTTAVQHGPHRAQSMPSGALRAPRSRRMPDDRLRLVSECAGGVCCPHRTDRPHPSTPSRTHACGATPLPVRTRRARTQDGRQHAAAVARARRQRGVVHGAARALPRRRGRGGDARSPRGGVRSPRGGVVRERGVPRAVRPRFTPAGDAVRVPQLEFLVVIRHAYDNAP